MEIRRPLPTDHDVLLDVWLRSVQATHTFVSQADITEMTPQVRKYLASAETDFWVVCDESDRPMGFMGLGGSQIESLFLAPEFLRRGTGRRMIDHARTLHSELTVDVNEQNADAVAFYQAVGFVVERRSELDDQGRPYPLLHLRWPAAQPQVTQTESA